MACCHMNNITTTSPLIQMLLYVARGNIEFSRAVLREALVSLNQLVLLNIVWRLLSLFLQHQCGVVSASELKNLAQLLQEILVYYCIILISAQLITFTFFYSFWKIVCNLIDFRV